MCILPKFEPSDLKELEQKNKKSVKNTEAKTVEIMFPEQKLEKLV